MLLFSDSPEWEPDVDINVCCLKACVRVFLTKSLWEKTWPQFHTSKPPGIFFFLPPLPHHVLFTPLEAARFPLFILLFHRPTLTWLQCVSLHPTAVFIIPAFACIPFRVCLFCLERQKKTCNVEDTPPMSNPDGSQSFHIDQRDVTHQEFKGIHSHDTVSWIHSLVRRPSPGRMTRRARHGQTRWRIAQKKSKGQFVWGRQTCECWDCLRNNKLSRQRWTCFCSTTGTFL